MNLRIWGHILFCGRPGAHPGGQPGANPRPTANGRWSADTIPTSSENRFVFWCSFSLIFCRFGEPRCSQNPPKSWKNALQNRTWFSYRFRYHFYQFFLNFRDHRTPQIRQTRLSVVVFYTFSDLRLASLVESIVDDFGIDLGRLLASIFKQCKTKDARTKSSQFCVCLFSNILYRFSAPRWQSTGPR